MKHTVPALLVGVTLATTIVAWNPTLLAHLGEPGLAAAWWRSFASPIRNAGLGFDAAFLVRWVPAILIAVLFGASAIAAASLLSARLPLPALRSSTRGGVCFLAGLGMLSPVLGLLATLGPAGRVCAAVAALALTLAAARRGAFVLPAIRLAGRSPMQLAVLVPIVIAGLAALSPPVQSDGLRYHLVAAQEWHYQGFDAYLRFNSFTNLPNLLALATSFGWPHAEVFQLLHFAGYLAMVAIAGELAGCCVRAVDPGAEERAVAAGRLLAASVPVVAIVASWPFADVAASACVLACAAVGLVSLERQAPAMPTAAWMGLCAGTAAAFKLTAGPMALVASFAVLAWWMRMEGRSKSQWRACVAWCAACAVPMLPFLVRNLANVGNPLYFPLPGLVGMGDWTPECAAFYAAKAAEKGLGRGIGDFLLSPVATAFRWDIFEGQNPGAAWPAMLVLAVRYGTRRNSSASARRPILALAAATWALWFIGYQSMRFAMVPVVLVACLAGAGWAREFATSPSRLGRALPLWLAAPGIAWILWWNAFGSATPPLQASIAPHENVLSRAFNSYPTVMSLEREIAANRPREAEARSIRVFYVGEHRGAYASAFEPAHSDWFDTPRVLNSIRGTKSNAEILAEWPKRRVDYVLVNLAELRLYSERYFRPRFTPTEWGRFESLLAELHARRMIGDDAIFVAAVRDAATIPPEAPPRTR